MKIAPVHVASAARDPYFGNASRFAKWSAYLHRSFQIRPVEVVPGLETDSEMYMLALTACRLELSRKFPTGKGTLFPDSWGFMASLQGVQSNPAGVPPFISYPRAVAKLRESPYSTHQKYADDLEAAEGGDVLDSNSRAFCKTFFEVTMAAQGPLRSVPLKKEAIIGLPTLSKAMEDRAVMVDKWVQKYEELGRLIDAADFRTLWEAHEIVIASINGYRNQPEQVDFSESPEGKPKIRPVLTAKGELVEQSRVLPFKVPDKARPLYTCRPRQTSAYSASSLYPLRHVARADYAHLAGAYPHTFVHHGPGEIESKLAGAHTVVMVDVMNNDQNVPIAHRDEFISRIGALYGDTMGDLCKYAFTGPILVHSDTVGATGGYWYGNPLDVTTFVAKYVNNSGNPHTSEMCKRTCACAAAELFALHGMIGRTAKDISSLLAGELLFGVLDLGDNMIFYDKRPLAKPGSTFTEDWFSLLPYYRFDRANTFMGYIVNQGQGLLWNTMPNVQSWVKNYVMPDRDFSYKGNPYKAAGYVDFAPQYYGKHPAFDEVRSIVDSCFERWVGYPLTALYERHYVAPPSNVESVNYATLRFSQDPDSIHYAVDESEVNPKIFGQVFFTVTPEMAEPMWAHFTRRG